MNIGYESTLLHQVVFSYLMTLTLPSSSFAPMQEGRRVWDNLRKLLIFNLPVNFAQGFTIFFGEGMIWVGKGARNGQECGSMASDDHSSLLPAYVVGFKEAPLTATQVLYVNLVTAVTMGM